MGKYKTSWKKARLVKEKLSSKAAPRWVDLRVFGLARARFRSVKRFRSRHWRRGASKVDV